MNALDRLLEIESSSGVWEAQAGGIHLWPIVRFAVLRQKWNEAVGFEHQVFPGRGAMWPRVVRQWPRTRRMLRHGRGTLFVTHATSRQSTADGRGSFDRLHDAYFQHVGDPLILETAVPGIAHPPDQRWDSHLYLQDAVWAWAKAKSMCRAIGAADGKVIDEFVDHVMRSFELPTHWRDNRGLLAWAVKMLRDFRLPKDIGPVAFVSNASLMGPLHTIYVTALKRRGVKVLEVQHGYIGRSTASYNYPDCATDDAHPCRQYLPDALLTFGDWWSSQVRMPIPVTAVGYPYLDEKAAAAGETDPDRVLIVSQGMEVEAQMIEATQALAAAMPAASITYKLHPAEYGHVDRFHSLAALPNVDLVADADVHGLLAGHGTVVGYFSTVLFEALKFGDKRVFYAASDLVPPELGAAFTSPAELVELMRDSAAGRPRLDAAELWARDFDARLSAALGAETASA